MPFKTQYGSHYHMTEGCHGATIPCGTEGLTPCSDCCGGAGGEATGSQSPGAGSGFSGHGGFEAATKGVDEVSLDAYEGMYDPSMPVRGVTELSKATVIEHENGIMEAVVDSSFIEGMSFVPGRDGEWDTITISFRSRYVDAHGMDHSHYAYTGAMVSRGMFERIVSGESVGHEANALIWSDGVKTVFLQEDGGIPVGTIPRGILTADMGRDMMSGADAPADSVAPADVIASRGGLTDVAGNMGEVARGKPSPQPVVPATRPGRTFMVGDVEVSQTASNQFSFPHGLTDGQMEAVTHACQEQYVKALGDAIRPTDTVVPYVANTPDGVEMRYGFYSPEGIYDWTMENGGMSLGFSDGSMPSDGYMVALVGPETPEEESRRRVLPLEGRRPDEDEMAYRRRFCREIEDYVSRNTDVLTEDAWYLGTWVDEEGTCFIEMSERVEDREQAVVTGRRRNQKKIWDVLNMEEIDTGGTGVVW